MSEREHRQIRGRVKWFDAARGYGFVVPEDGGRDVLIHANVLRNYGQSTVAEGAGIVADMVETPRGRQIVLIHEITPPPADEAPPLELPDPGDAPLEPARVKWFDRGRGFGFVNTYGRPEDVFVHMEVLRRCGFADLVPGEAVAVRVAEGSRGRVAVEVRAWDWRLVRRENGDRF